MSTTMEPVIFFSSAPTLENLCAITVRVKKATQLQVTTQLHVLKCREFIFSEPSIIASPSFDLDGCFNAIMQISVCKSGKLQNRMQKLGLEFSKPFRVHPTLYQSCLRYTVTARLAPSWNKAGEWLIQGRDFVTQHGHTNAVKLNLCVNKDEIFASLCGTMLRSPPLQVEDLNLSRQEMLDILKSTQEDGRQVELQDSWCHVLPSMKKGRVLAVSLLVPSDSPFAGYNELKRHWKNTYGYRLPETDEDILYCQVSFLASGGGKHFTYPDVCLRTRPAQFLSRVDCKPILSSFIQDLHARVGHVCGQPLRFTPKMHFTSVALHDANEEVSHASLSNRRNNSTKTKAPLRSSQNIMHIKQKSTPQDQPTLRNKLVQQTGVDPTNFPPRDPNEEKDKKENRNIDDINSHLNQPNSQSVRDPYDNTQKISSTTTSAEGVIRNVDHSKESQSMCENNIPSNSISKKCYDTNKSPLPGHQNPKAPTINICNSKTLTVTKQSAPPLTSQPHKIIPIFKPQKKLATTSNNVAASRKECKAQINKCTPVFKSRTHPSSLQSNDKQQTRHAKPPNISSSNLNSTRAMNPKPQGAQVVTPSTSLQSQSDNTATTTPFFPVFRATMKPVVNNYKQPTNLVKQSPKTKATIRNPKQLPNASQPSPSRQFNTPISSKSSPSLTSLHIGAKCSTPVRKALPQFSSVDMQLSTDSPFSHFKGKANILSSLAAATHPVASPSGSMDMPAGVKRKVGLSGSAEPGTPGTPTAAKKPRTKPQVQNLDIDALARSNQLSKANTATLISWLKERGVTCRAKDKKTDLIEKVQNHLNLKLTAPEA